MKDLAKLGVEEGAVLSSGPEKHVILVEDLNKWGCPSCGYRSGHCPLTSGGASLWQCGECSRTCFLLSYDGVPHGMKDIPPLTSHPREGTPSHGRPDTRPEGGGEFFSSRGIGTDSVPSCFACGVDLSDTYVRNISAFVQCKEAGERVVAMLRGRARLDYRELEPDRVQVKVGVCSKHLINLERLDALTTNNNRIITDEIIKNPIVSFGD